MTWFCSWLSNEEADGSGPSWDVGRKLCRPRMEESGEKMERKESEVRCQLHVTRRGRQVLRQRLHRQETWDGSLGFRWKGLVLGELPVREESRPHPQRGAGLRSRNNLYFQGASSLREAPPSPER